MISFLSRVGAPLYLETRAERARLKAAGHPQTQSWRLPDDSSRWRNQFLSELWEAQNKTNPSCGKEKMCSLPPRLVPVGSSLHRHWQEGEEKEKEEGGGISSNILGCQSSCSMIPLLQGCSRQFSSATCPENPFARGTPTQECTSSLLCSPYLRRYLPTLSRQDTFFTDPALAMRFVFKAQ